jgi:hypothetical protein
LCYRIKQEVKNFETKMRVTPTSFVKILKKPVKA